MKHAYLIVNGAVLRFAVKPEALDNFGQWLGDTAATRKNFFWEKRLVSVWKGPEGVIVIQHGHLDGYFVVDAPDDVKDLQSELQKEALNLIKKQSAQIGEGDNWKNS